MLYYYVLAAAVISILFSLYLVFNINKAPSGSEKMKEVAKEIHKGAQIFLKKEFKAMAVLFLIIGLMLWYLNKSYVPPLIFLGGAFTSALAGFLGMWVATKTNVRVTQAARKDFPDSFKLAFQGGKMMGFLVVGLGLLGIMLLWMITKKPPLLINYAFGASLVALFMRVGGGVYTKSADVGADLVGKVEQGIPEDDPRNPGVIADQVGDNVGDTAGMGSDLFESYVSSIIAVMVLGMAKFGFEGLILPVVLAAAGIISSLIGSFIIRIPSKFKESDFSVQTQKVRRAMQSGTLFANLLMIIASYFIVQSVLGRIEYFYVIVLGLATGYLIGWTTEYFTSEERKPVLGIAKASETGSSMVITEGLTVGMKSVFLPALAVATTVVLAYYFGEFYGVALASVGILGTLGLNLSTDCYGPIADNAAGISETADLKGEVRKRTEALDAVGNTTAATGKGFAIGAAALAALAWLATYFEQANMDTVNFLNPGLIAGLLVGGGLTFLFSSLSLKAVSEGAEKVVKEVRRQFEEIEGLLKGEAKADYEKCIALTTEEALKRMVLPALIVVVAPILIGLLLGPEAIGGLLAGALITAFPMALFMANSGGAWDNAKKYIEAGNLGGKGSEAHKAAVVGDTIGDPFKDTAGPSLNILIKLLGVVSLISLPLFF